jgi:hypothetical protein
MLDVRSYGEDNVEQVNSAKDSPASKSTDEPNNKPLSKNTSPVSDNQPDKQSRSSVLHLLERAVSV